MNREVSVWVVNQYADKPPAPGTHRHHTFARLMHDDNVRLSLIAANRHYSSGRETVDLQSRSSKLDVADDVPILWLRAKAYSGNGLGRVLSMLSFAVATIRRGWSPRRVNLAKPDVIIGSSPHLFGALAGWVLAKRHRAQFILEVCDVWPASLVDLLGLRRTHPLVIVLRRIEKLLYKKSRAIVTLLDGLEPHVRESVRPPIPPVIWIPNGVEVAALPPAAPLVDTTDFTIVYAGAHGVANSLHTAVEAALQLRDAGAAPPGGGQYRFHFYGEGVSKPDLLAYCAKHQLSNVVFHDLVPKSEIFALLSDADAFLLTWRATDLYRHGISPAKLFDYFAAGRPILMAIDLPTNPVAAAAAGVTVPAENAAALAAAISELAWMPLADRQRMGDNGRRYVAEHHDMRKLAERYSATVRSTLPR